MIAPTIEECYALFDKYKVPATVRAHCEAAYKVASALTNFLAKINSNNKSSNDKSSSNNILKINMGIVLPFALLHDFMKAVVLEQLGAPSYSYQPTTEELEMHQKLRKQYVGLSETKVSYLILKDKYPEFAQLFLELDELTKNPKAKVTPEAKFIHYIDWRVLGNKVVPLKVRMDYIYEHYGQWIKKMNIDWETSQQEQYDYERNLFNALPFNPEELEKQVKL